MSLPTTPSLFWLLWPSRCLFLPITGHTPPFWICDFVQSGVLTKDWETFFLQSIYEQLGFLAGAPKHVLGPHLWENMERIAREKKAFVAHGVHNNNYNFTGCRVSG